MKKYTVRNIYNNKTEVVITDEKGVANVVRMGYDVVKVEAFQHPKNFFQKISKNLLTTGKSVI